MNGKIINQWTFDTGNVNGSVSRVELLKNRHVAVLMGGGWSDPTGVQEYDWDSGLVSEYLVPSGYRTHHDFDKKSNGNWLFICYESVPEENRKMAQHPRRREELYSDVILEVTPDKEIVWEYVHETGNSNRSHRYPYDYCPALQKLESPRRMPSVSTGIHASRAITTPEGVASLRTDIHLVVVVQVIE